MTASPDTPDKEHKKWVIPVDYNLYCKIGETIYFFNQDEVDAYYELATPSEEDSDEDSGQLAPCDILDWMEEKVGHDGITAWGRFDEIRLMGWPRNAGMIAAMLGYHRQSLLVSQRACV